jgi:catechol 2,3-dioxygenase-like lactoylglutathione lyase family enzyme
VSALAEDRLECIPILPSVDIAATADFYVASLGFAAQYRAEDYLIVRRDAVEIHFWLTDDRSLCERSSIYVRGGAIGRWHAEFETRGVPQLTAIALRPWGMEEFYIHDPHGNLLRFGRVSDATRD